jgi:hypothetical protein
VVERERINIDAAQAQESSNPVHALQRKVSAL